MSDFPKLLSWDGKTVYVTGVYKAEFSRLNENSLVQIFRQFMKCFSRMSFIVLNTPGTLNSRNGLKNSQRIKGLNRYICSDDLHFVSHTVFCARERLSTSNQPFLIFPFSFIFFSNDSDLTLNIYHRGTEANSWKSHFHLDFHEVSLCFSIEEST